MALLFFGGSFAAAAYNTRTIYIFSVFIIFLCVAQANRGSKRYLIPSFLLGFALLSLPQALINKQKHGVFHPNPTIGLTGSLFVAQLQWGIWMQKYETSILPTSPSPRMFYVDPTGLRFAAETCKNPVDSIKDYINTVIHNPLIFLGIYTRHFVNAMDIRDGNVYVHRARPGKRHGIIASSLLMIAAILAHKSRIRTKISNNSTMGGISPYLYAISLTIPAFAIIPGAVETRFMLPLIVMLSMTTFAFWSTSHTINELRKNPHLYFILSLLIIVLPLAIAQNTSTTLQYEDPDLGCSPHATNIH